LALRQHGLISLDQARTLGLDTWLTRSAGEWEKFVPGIYRLAANPETWHQALLGICLWGGAGTAASHSSAAALLRLRGFTETEIHVTSTKQSKCLPEWANVHRVSSPPLGTRRLCGIPCTPPWRTLLDLGSVAASEMVERALDDALSHGLTSLRQLHWALETYGGQGYRGTAVLRALVAARGAPGTRYVPPETELEALLYRLVDASDLPAGTRQHEIWDGTQFRRLDLAYLPERVAVEVDGYGPHAGREAFQNDRTRDNALTSMGWRVLRFTWDDVTLRPARVVTEIRRTLVQRGYPFRYRNP
jgi:very-short-patch-repair endonuclease